MSVWVLEKSFTFEASHQLPNHDGKCARLHGHSWIGRIVIRGSQLQTEGSKQGMLVDYGQLKALIAPIVEQYLDHWHLNDTLELENPTSEEIARWIYRKIYDISSWWADMIFYIEINETCTSACRYYPHNV